MPAPLLDVEAQIGAKNPLDPITGLPATDVPANIYDEKDRDYLSFLQNRLHVGRDQKLIPYPEFNNVGYYQYYEANEKLANTYLEGKKNDDDVIVSAGTVETKLDAVLSAVANLDFSPDVFAYDQDNNDVASLGTAMRDIIKQTEEMDGADGAGDEEKKLLRQRELLKQGTVFVQDEWVRKFKMVKRLKDNYNGQFKDTAEMWSENLEKVFDGPQRSLIYGPNVYMGNITEFHNDNQPYIFCAYYHDYDVMKMVYGKFDNWKYVKKGGTQLLPNNDMHTIYDNKWRLNQVRENQVETIIYQDQTRDEFQIIINGVLMLPIGFPLSAVSPGGGYNIIKQILRPFHDKFAYGKPFVAAGGIKEVSYLIDELLKLFVLKTRKSITPAYINTSGKIIPKKVLSPGRITMGIPPDALHAIGTESQGVTNNEFSVLKELQDRIDKTTVSPSFQGQRDSGTPPTATEIQEMARQAKLTLGLIITACMLLEKKLAYLRLFLIIENWFDPTGTTVQTIGDVRSIVNQYRSTNTKAPLGSGGMGERRVIPMEGDLPSPEVIRKLEHNVSKDKGYPVKHIYLDPQGLKQAKLTWFISINPREKESSAYYLAKFREEITDMVSMVNLGSRPNNQGLEEKFAKIYEEPRQKLFSTQVAQPPQAPPSAGDSAPVPFGASGGGNAKGGGSTALKPAPQAANRPPTTGPMAAVGIKNAGGTGAVVR